jgi:signal transduction histidine kinase
VFIAIVRSVSFLVVGYFISRLMRQIQAQQDALAQANAQLTHYASTLENLATSRERNRLARELHDTLAHTLSGLTVQLETVKAYWDVNPETAHHLLAQSLDATRSGLDETRRAVKALRASPLEDMGLLLGLKKLAESAAERGKVALELSLPEQIPSLSPDVEQCVYRIAQEAVENVVHHANAGKLILRLTVDKANIFLAVEDDGLGLKVDQAEQAGHYGLAGMRERAQLAGGRLSVSSQPDHGTRVHLAIEGYRHDQSADL